MNTKGTETRKSIFEFIKNYVKENQYPPTFREIGVAVGIKSTNTIYCHMHKLQEMGVVVLDESRARTIKIVGELEV